MNKNVVKFCMVGFWILTLCMVAKELTFANHVVINIVAICSFLISLYIKSRFQTEVEDE